MPYAVGEIDEIAASSNSFNPAEEYEIDYRILTSTGVDVTEFINEEDVEFNATSDVVNSDGTISAGALEDGESIFVEIEYAGESSERIQLTANTSEPVELVNYNVGEVSNWDADDFEADQTIAVGEPETLDVYFVDQYGNEANDDNVTFKSLTPETLIVDQNTGALTPRSEGTAEVRVTNGDVSDIITIEVEAEPEATGLSFDHQNLEEGTLTLNPSVSGNTANVEVQLEDQYEENYPAAEELTIEVTGDSVTATEDTITTSENGSATINLEIPNEEYGTSTVTVSNEDGSISESFEVNVVEAGIVAGYEIQGVQNLDLYDAEDEDESTNNHFTTVQVFPVDENGVEVENAENATWTLLDENGEQVGDTATGASVTVGADGELSITEPGTYTVEATVGDLAVASETFEVVDTEAPYEIDQQATETSVGSEGGNLFNAIKNDILDVEQNGESANEEIEQITAYSTNIEAVSNSENGANVTLGGTDENVVLGSEGTTTTLYIDTVTIDGEQIDIEDIAVEVSVTDDVAPPAPQVYEVATDDTVVTGTAEPGSEVTVSVGGEEIGTTTADEEGNFTVEIDAQDAGTELSVTATDGAGNTSDAQPVTVSEADNTNEASIDAATYNAASNTLDLSVSNIEEGSEFDLSGLAYSDGETTASTYSLNGEYTLADGSADGADEAGEYSYNATEGTLTVILTDNDANSIESLNGFGNDGQLETDTINVAEGWNTDANDNTATAVEDLEVAVEPAE